MPLVREPPVQEPPIAVSHRRRRLRAVVVTLAAVIGLLAIVDGLLHTPVARRYAWDRVTSYARARFGVELRATSFRYDLTRLSFTLRDLEVAAATSPAAPFLGARAVEVRLSWRALTGALDLRSVIVDHPRIDLRLAGDAGPNVPTTSRGGPPSDPLPSFFVHELHVNGLAVGTRAQNAEFTARDVGLEFLGPRERSLQGHATFAGGATLIVDDVRIAIDAADADLAFDGEVISVRSLHATAAGGPLHAGGRVTVAGASSAIDVSLDWRPDMAHLSAWNSAWPRMTGQLQVDARATGTLDDPRVTIKVAGRDIGSPFVARSDLTAAARLASDGLDVQSFEIRIGRGVVRGNAGLAFGLERRSEATVAWSDIHTTAFASALPQIARASEVRSTGRADLRWIGFSPSAATLAGTAQAALAPAGPHHLGEVSVTANGRDGRWRISARDQFPGNTVVDGLIDVRFDSSSWRRSSLDGTISVSSTHPPAALEHLRHIGVPIPPLGAVVPEGPLSMHATLSGSLGQPRATGNASLENLLVQRAGRWAAAAAFTADSRGVTLLPLTLEGPVSAIEARGTLGLAAEGTGVFQLTIADVGAMRNDFPERWRPRGGLRATGRWSGTLQRPHVALDLEGEDLSVGSTRVDRITGQLVYDDRVVFLERLDVQQAEGGRLHVAGHVNMRDRTGAIEANGNGLRVEPTTAAEVANDPPGIAVVGHDVSVSLSLEGSLSKPHGRVTARASQIHWNRRELGAVSLTLDAHDGLADVIAQLPALNATTSGTIALASPYGYSARTTVEDIDIARLLDLWRAGTVARGDTTGRVHVLTEHAGELANDPLARVRVEVGAFEGRFAGVPISLSQPVRMDLEGGKLTMQEVALSLGGLGLRARGAAGPPPGSFISMDIDGSIDGLRPLLGHAEPGHAWDVGGEVTGHLELGLGAHGSTLGGQIRATNARVSRDGVAIANALSASAAFRDNRLHLERFSGDVFGGSLEGSLDAPLSWATNSLPESWRPVSAPEPATLRARATIDVPRALGALGLKQLSKVTGGLELNVVATASRPALDAITAHIVADRIQLGAFDELLSLTAPARAVVSNNVLVIEALDLKGVRSRVTAAGRVALAEGKTTDLRLEADLGFRVLDLLLPGRTVGRGRADVRVSGTPGNYRVTGDLALADVGLILPGSRFALAGWSGTLGISDDVLSVKSLRGQLNGGEVTVEGELPWQRSARDGKGLILSARGVFLEIPDGLRSQADAQLDWKRTGERTTISGQVTLSSSSYREPVTRMLELVDALNPKSARGTPARRLPAWVEAAGLDIALESSEPVVFENSLGRLEMIPRIRLVGSVAAPALAGRVDTLDDGRLTLAGRTYRVMDSSLRFAPAEGLAPTFNLQGETRIGEYDIVLRVTGTPARVETSFTSSPPLGERDLRSLVVTGRTETADTQGVSGDQFAVGAASSDVLGFAGKFVGLDSVRLGAADLELVSTDVRPAQHLTVTKSLGRQFEVIVSENLDDNKLTWVFVWRPTRHYQFRVTSRENTDQSLEFRQELQFGPGARSAGAGTSRARATRARVLGVTVAGQPGFSQSELINALKLSRGDPFDFRKWLADRDRLEAFYRERGYFAARIVSTRREVPNADGVPGVELAYTIQRGRRTTLNIVGDELPGDTLRQMQIAWGETPVVDFLRDDLTRIAHTALLEHGYLRARVETTVIEESATAVTLSVSVARGPRSTRRELVFTGNTSLNAAELHRFAESRQLEPAAWTDPAAFSRYLEDLYASRGFLRAGVTLGAPLFEGDTARLPVNISEGPTARVERVSLEGVAASRDASARLALAIGVDTVYAERAEQAAQHRLEEFYRDLGFRDARVAVRPAVSDDGARVRLDVRVAEGPLHRVRDVTISGLESTNPGMVQKAIALQPAGPASQSAATTTRQRLYDTGVFRSADVTFEPVTTEQNAGAVGEIPVDALISLEESRRFLLRYGVEFAHEYDPTFESYTNGVGVSADLRDRNFLGRGITAGIGARYDPDLHSIRSLVSFPRFWRVPVRSNAAVTFRDETTSEPGYKLIDNEYDVTFEQRLRAASHVDLTWGYTYQNRDITIDIPAQDFTEINVGGVLAGLTGAVVVDYRDSPFDATRGWFHSSSVQLAARALGSDFGYARYLLRQYYYQPVGPVTLAAAARWGTMATRGGVPPITVLDVLFKAGGTTTVRGYAEESLSATEFLGVPIGGTELLLLNGEVRFPIAGWFKGVVFADAGNAFRGQSDLSLRGLAVGLGFGLRVKTPLAPIRIDLGFPVPERPGLKSPRLHFSIGQMF